MVSFYKLLCVCINFQIRLLTEIVKTDKGQEAKVDKIWVKRVFHLFYMFEFD